MSRKIKAMARANDSRDGGGGRTVRRQEVPRWVKIFGVAGIVLIVLFIVLHVSGHGFGGHSMHHFMR